jgi:hypothetical protein
MFSREESKKIRQEFWTQFGKQSPKKWLLYNTGIKEINLKFHFDNKLASVAFIIDTEDEILKPYYFEKFLSLKTLLLDEIDKNLIFNQHHETEIGKIVAQIYLQKERVSIHNKNIWPEVFEFFNQNMPKFEAFFLEYKEFIES